MKKTLKRIGIVLLIITFPVWIFPLMILTLALSILDDIFDLTWN